MPCIQHHEHCLAYCAVCASENRRSLTENVQELGQCGCLRSLILGGSMKSCCGRLGQMFINFSISHSMQLCSLWNTVKSCVSLCHHLKQEQYYYRKYVFILYNGAFEMAFV